MTLTLSNLSPPAPPLSDALELHRLDCLEGGQQFRFYLRGVTAPALHRFLIIGRSLTPWVGEHMAKVMLDRVFTTQRDVLLALKDAGISEYRILVVTS